MVRKKVSAFRKIYPAHTDFLYHLLFELPFSQGMGREEIVLADYRWKAITDEII